MQKPIIFQNPKQMLMHLTTEGKDLYNLRTGEYVFGYNDQDVICVYHLEETQAKTLAEETKNTELKWSELLGAHGSEIYDAPENEHWCINSYASEFWIHTEDLLDFLKRSEHHAS